MLIINTLVWWPGTDLNRRRQPFQGCALPTELPGLKNLRANSLIVTLAGESPLIFRLLRPLRFRGNHAPYGSIPTAG